MTTSPNGQTEPATGSDAAKRAETRRPLNLQPSPRVRSTTRRRPASGDPAVDAADAAEQTLVSDDDLVARDTGLASGTLDVSDSQLPALRDEAAGADADDDSDGDDGAGDDDADFQPDQPALTHTLGLDAGVTLGTVQHTGISDTGGRDQLDHTVESGHRDAGAGRPGAPADARTVTHGGGGDRATSNRLASLANSATSDRRYRVQRELARGGMGAIMIARDHDLRRDVAMKVLLGARRKDADANRKSRGRVARFLEEAQITGQLEHPNIVPVHDLGVDAGGRLFFTMKLVDGEALSDILLKLRHQIPGETPYKGFSRARLLEVFSKVCDAVAYAHSRGVVHRDLKPANIMVGAFGEVMVMDWGIAKIIRQDGTDTSARRPGSDVRGRGAATAPARTARVSDRRPRTLGATANSETPQIESERTADGAVVTMDGAVIGTPAYMAPEQARGEIDQISERTDVYALGAILYEILALQPPYEGDTPLDVLKRVQTGRGMVPPERKAPERDVPAELGAICVKAMSRVGRARYESVEALHNDLTRWQDGLPVSVYRDTAAGRTIKWMKRHKLQTAMLAATLLIAVTVIVSLGLTLQAKAGELAEAQRAADANRRAISAEQAARDMAEALAELDRIRLTVRSGAGLESAADALVKLRQKAPGLYPAAFELQRVLDMLARDDEATTVLESLRDDASAPSNVRAQAAVTLGMRVVERTLLPHPDAVDDLVAAQPHFERATELSEPGTPLHVAARALHSVAYAAIAPDVRAIEEANAAAEDAVRECPTMWEPWYALARARALPATPVRRTDKAPTVSPGAVILACNKVLAVEPGSFAAWRLRARYTLEWDDILVLREYEASNAAHLIEAHARRLDGDATRAFNQVRALAESHPGNGWILLELAECARVVGNRQLALESVNGAIEMLPDANVPRRVRARILMELTGDRASLQLALGDLNTVLERDPNDLPALGLRGILHARLNRLREAETDFTTYIRNHATASVHDARAHVRMALGDLDNASTDWQRSVQLDSSRFLTWTAWYRSLWAAGRVTDALNAMTGAEESAIEALRPGLAEERQRLVQAASRVRAWEQANGRPYRVARPQLAEWGQQLLQSGSFGENIHHELAMTVIELNRRHRASRTAGRTGLGGVNDQLPTDSVEAQSLGGGGGGFGERFSLNRGRRQQRPHDRRNRDGDEGDPGPHAGAHPANEPATGDEREADDAMAEEMNDAEDLQRRMEEVQQELRERAAKAEEKMRQQWSRNTVQRSVAMHFTASEGLAVLLGQREPDPELAQQKLQQAATVLTTVLQRFRALEDQAPETREALAAMRGFALIARSEGRVLSGDLAAAARDVDAAARVMQLEPMYAYYAAAVHMALASSETRGDDAPLVEHCRERALGYLESAVLMGLDNAAARANHALFAPLRDDPRFRALFE